MKVSTKAKIIMTTLNKLYPETPIPLNHKNNFTLLVAVILSAQSTDKKVNELTEILFKEANTPEEFISLGENNIFNHIKQLGLAKQKAKNIYLTAERIIKKFKGKLPDNYNDLESLPGVGHKTASVIMAQAFNYPSFPVDTHIHRLSQRWRLTNGKSVVQTENDLKRIFPQSEWNKLHLQIIFYGREHCTARKCDGTKCLLCKELFPRRKKPVLHRKA